MLVYAAEDAADATDWSGLLSGQAPLHALVLDAAGTTVWEQGGGGVMIGVVSVASLADIVVS